MEEFIAFILPLLYAALKKGIAALMMITFFFWSLRFADKVLGIQFKELWDDIESADKVKYLNMRMLVFAMMFLGCFAFV